MLSDRTYECPRCGGAIDLENFSEVRLDDRIDRFLRCEHCDVGWESSQYANGDLYVLDYHERTEPVNFGKFVQRLEDARAA